ncbi:hypothetical protein BC828DRAFT_412979 [Blastocladiella britannica]|nr:hypothetical protein BC828DRAFT_412979 [Blastocladiella britannica]
MIYLEDYCDAVEALPANLQQFLSRLRTLDSQVYHDHRLLRADLATFLQSAHCMPQEERASLLLAIKARIAQCKDTDNERALTAMAAKETVNHHIARANANYCAFCMALAQEESKMKKKPQSSSHHHHHHHHHYHHSRQATDRVAESADPRAKKPSPSPMPAAKRARRDDGSSSSARGAAARHSGSPAPSMAVAALTAAAAKNAASPVPPPASSRGHSGYGGSGNGGGGTTQTSRPDRQRSGGSSRRATAESVTSVSASPSGAAMVATTAAPSAVTASGAASAAAVATASAMPARKRSAAASTSLARTGTASPAIADDPAADAMDVDYPVANGGAPIGSEGQDLVLAPPVAAADVPAVVDADPSVVSASLAADVVDPMAIGVVEDGEDRGEDDEHYCICDPPVECESMINCDNEQCPTSWFHLTCVGLEVAPEGSWFCDHCTQQRQAQQRTARRTRGRGG